MRTVSGWHGKRKSSTTRLIRSMPLTPLRVASGRISWLSFESEEGQKEFEAWKRQQDKERVEQENQLKAA